MKLIKRITSTMLSMTIIAGTAAADIPAKMTTSATEPTNSILLRETVISEMGKRIDEEMKKFGLDPEKDKQKAIYWNHKEKDSIDGEYNWTTTPCDHVVDYAKDEKCCNHTKVGDKYLCQCYAFAYLLAKDIWETTEFYEYTVVDHNYEPQVGDNVRLRFEVENEQGEMIRYQDHSIFITGISGDNITFAECNGDLQDCKIVWNRTEYYDRVYGDRVSLASVYGDERSLTEVTKDYLRKYATEYYRPIIAGDFNMDGSVDLGDGKIFESTIMTNGERALLMPDNQTYNKDSYYDVNGDGYINKDDYNDICDENFKPRIVKPDEDTQSQFRSLTHSSGFLFDRCYYVPNDIGGVSWIGSVDSEVDTVYVPSKVKCDKDGCWYDVTEIGYDGCYNGHPYKTCTEGYKINTIYIPDSVKRIHSYAFDSWSLTSLRFSGSDPQLETIGDFAFYGCNSLKKLDLSPAKNLKSIGFNAFDKCTQLNAIILPYTGKSLYLASNGKGIFGNVDPSNITIKFKNSISEIPMGDLNMDNVLDKADIELLKNYLTASGNLNSNQALLADLDINGIIDDNDFELLTKKYDVIIRFDLNGDKLNNNNDFALLQCVITKKKKLSMENTYKADYNNDGVVDAKDAEEMIKYLEKRSGQNNYMYYRMGDLNLDGTVDKNDLIALQEYGNKHISFKADYKLADFNFDGIVDKSDYKILKALTKYQIGDVDFSGTVDIADRDRIMKHIANGELLPDDALWYGDLNGDGAIDTKDITQLCRDYNIPDYQLGDVDFNGTVDKADKELIMNHIANIELLPNVALSYADVNRDCCVDVLDVVQLCRDYNITD